MSRHNLELAQTPEINTTQTESRVSASYIVPSSHGGGTHANSDHTGKLAVVNAGDDGIQIRSAYITLYEKGPGRVRVEQRHGGRVTMSAVQLCLRRVLHLPRHSSRPATSKCKEGERE